MRFSGALLILADTLLLMLILILPAGFVAVLSDNESEEMLLLIIATLPLLLLLLIPLILLIDDEFVKKPCPFSLDDADADVGDGENDVVGTDVDDDNELADDGNILGAGTLDRN